MVCKVHKRNVVCWLYYYLCIDKLKIVSLFWCWGREKKWIIQKKVKSIPHPIPPAPPPLILWYFKNVLLIKKVTIYIIKIQTSIKKEKRNKRKKELVSVYKKTYLRLISFILIFNCYIQFIIPPKERKWEKRFKKDISL